MDTRVAILAIIAHDNGSAQEINAILHEHAEYIIGRMGLPYRERGMNIISCLLYTSPSPRDTR